MTETNPAPDPSVTAPSVQDAQTGADPVDPPADPPAEKPAKAPRKRAASKTAASKTAAPAPESSEHKDSRSLYLPALPEGFAYTTITATGANGETITVEPTADGASLSFEGAGLNRQQNYPDVKAAIAAGAKAAKSMAKIAEREAELARVREEALGL